MSTFNNKTSSTRLSSGTHSVESIREWRHSIEKFFNEDWPQLADFILTIEESLWEDGHHESVVNGLENPSRVESENHASLASQNDSETSPTGGENYPSPGEPEQQRRLEELARKIEERLMKTDSREEIASDVFINTH